MAGIKSSAFHPGSKKILSLLDRARLPECTMKWILINQKEASEIEASECFPWSKPSPVSYLIRKEDSLQFLIQPDFGAASMSSLPAAILEPDDLAVESIWMAMLIQNRPRPAELASYAASRSHIPAHVLLKVMGWSINYRTRQDWDELANLDENTLDLDRKYEFPLNILRLWNRIEQRERGRWMEIWRVSYLKKNLVREIIQDYYDLGQIERQGALDEAETICRRYKESGKTSAVFPGEALRDSVRERRFPKWSSFQKDIYALNRALKLPPRCRLETPRSPEIDRLSLHLEFGSTEELKDQLQALLQPGVQAKFPDLFERLS